MKAYQSIQVEKFYGTKTLLYKTEKYPALVDSTGKGDYFPTRIIYIPHHKST
jgi:hypothetical protein